jgi:hypothetical protein
LQRILLRFEGGKGLSLPATRQEDTNGSEGFHVDHKVRQWDYTGGKSIFIGIDNADESWPKINSNETRHQTFSRAKTVDIVNASSMKALNSL